MKTLLAGRLKGKKDKFNSTSKSHNPERLENKATMRELHLRGSVGIFKKILTVFKINEYVLNEIRTKGNSFVGKISFLPGKLPKSCI